MTRGWLLRGTEEPAEGKGSGGVCGRRRWAELRWVRHWWVGGKGIPLCRSNSERRLLQMGHYPCAKLGREDQRHHPGLEGLQVCPPTALEAPRGRAHGSITPHFTTRPCGPHEHKEHKHAGMESLPLRHRPSHAATSVDCVDINLEFSGDSTVIICICSIFS